VSTQTAAPPARLKTRYLEEIRPALMQRFGYSSVMQAPKIEKIVLNMGVGDAKQDSKALEAAQEQLATIAGQKPNVRRARKSIANFKLREGMPVGLAVTLRNERAYEFLDRLLSVAIPRIRDFRGLKANAFDGRGNYTLGVREQTIFPEIDYDAIDQVRGLDVVIVTTAQSDLEAFALLEAFGMPFTKENRPQAPPAPADADLAAREAEAEDKRAAEAAAREQLKAEDPEAYERAAATTKEPEIEPEIDASNLTEEAE
jgi:large subunit ribosomal protein L5